MALRKDKNARTKLLGSIAYIRGSDRFARKQAIFVSKLDSFEVADTVVYIEPGTHSTVKRFSLNNLGSAAGTNLIARNLTGIGGANSTFDSDWQKSSISEGSSLIQLTMSSLARAAPTYVTDIKMER